MGGVPRRVKGVIDTEIEGAIYVLAPGAQDVVTITEGKVASVWRSCDGRKDEVEISHATGLPSAEVAGALVLLRGAGLVVDREGMSRRSALVSLAAGVGGVSLLPMTAASAVSPSPTTPPPPPPPCLCAPVYEPLKWNAPGGMQDKNNCYNYGCNIVTNTFARPGRQSGAPVTRPLSCPQVTAAAINDGLTATTLAAGCPCVGTGADCCFLVALAIDPTPGDSDFHWYRRDRDGTWSQKHGDAPATNKGDDGNPLVNPENAASRGDYTDFCGYFCVCAGKVNIQ